MIFIVVFLHPKNTRGEHSWDQGIVSLEAIFNLLVHLLANWFLWTISNKEVNTNSHQFCYEISLSLGQNMLKRSKHSKIRKLFCLKLWEIRFFLKVNFLYFLESFSIFSFNPFTRKYNNFLWISDFFAPRFI